MKKYKLMTAFLLAFTIIVMSIISVAAMPMPFADAPGDPAVTTNTADSGDNSQASGSVGDGSSIDLPGDESPTDTADASGRVTDSVPGSSHSGASTTKTPSTTTNDNADNGNGSPVAGIIIAIIAVVVIVVIIVALMPKKKDH